MKQCGRCKSDKSELDFSRDARRKDGLNRWCRECLRKYRLGRLQEPGARDRERKYQQVYRRHWHANPRNRDRHRRNQSQWRQDPKNRDRVNAYIAARSYGISIDEVLRLRSLTHCECCGDPLPADSKARHIDHCHDTGKVRGMVCRDCNHTMRGPAQECMARMEACLTYLRRHTE